jgi:6-phosphofructokinase 1
MGRQNFLGARLFYRGAGHLPKGNGFIAHGGGPTAVLNASLLGVIEQARHARMTRLWAGIGGLGGLLRGEALDLLKVSPHRLAGMARQPGSFIGSYRGLVTKDHIHRTIEFFRRHDIRYCFYTGGNGSMATALEISRTAAALDYDLMTVGIPKTVDNDICETDHCPGFGSAARFVSAAVRDIGLDQRALPSPVSIIEVMGRNVGWLAAASILARRRRDDPPHFIYVPERVFNPREFLARVDRLLGRFGWVVGVVAEGLHDASGRMLGASGASNRDAKGRPLAGNVSMRLADLVSRQLKVRARSEKPGLLCRAFSACISPVDAQEAYDIGRFAVRSAVAGKSDVMVALRRANSARYHYALALVPLSRVADRERALPAYYQAGTADIRTVYLDYVKPLIGPRLPSPVLIGG